MSETKNNKDAAGTDESQGQAPQSDSSGVDFHGAAVLDENGNATPITEEMVQEACAELERSRDTKPDPS